jgi:Nucleolar pre-ribosomal-associated protein 1
MKAFMNIVRNAGDGGSVITRLPKLISLFLAKCLPILMEPRHILYEKVNSFLLQRPSLDLRDIPMFYSLSNTGNHFEAEVDFLLNIITAGFDDNTVFPNSFMSFLITDSIRC